MNDLSPAAQAVLDAFDKQPFKKANGDLNVEGALAAALRAAADQAIPLTKTPWGTSLIPVLTSQESRDRILAIANELDPPTGEGD
jgi:hypothetical protein